MSDINSSLVDTSPKEDLDPKKLKPPNKKKFEEDLKKLQSSIEEKESQFKTLTSDNDNLGHIRSLQQEKATTIEERKGIDINLQALNKEINKQRDIQNKFRAGLHYQSEIKINEAISRLEYQLRTQNFRVNEEKKIVQEIDSLKRSKKSLKEYLTMKTDLDSMRQQQQTMRDRRDYLYKEETKLKFKEDDLKKENIRHRAARDGVKKEIDEYYDQKRRLKSDFNKQTLEFGAATKMRRQLSSKKREEERRAHQEAVLKEREELKEFIDPYAEEKQSCSALIHYLQRFIKDSSHSYSNPETPSEENAPVSFKSLPEEEGIYLLKKKTDDEVFVGLARGRSQKRSKKDKKKLTQNRLITHTPETLCQFADLRVLAPVSTSEIPTSLDQLLAKKQYYESLQLNPPPTPSTKILKGLQFMFSSDFVLPKERTHQMNISLSATSMDSIGLPSDGTEIPQISLNEVDQAESVIPTISCPELSTNELNETVLDTETGSCDLDNDGSSIGDRQSLSRQVSDEIRGHMRCEELNSTDSGLTDTDLEDDSTSTHLLKESSNQRTDHVELQEIIEGLSRHELIGKDIRNFHSSDLVLDTTARS